MLGKLLKYEMKAGLRLFPIIYLAGVLFFLLGLLAKTLHINQILTTAVVMLAIAAAASAISVIIFTIVRFFKGMFGAEGYLTQTLPVSKGSLLASRTIAAYVWMLIGVAMALLGVVGILYLVAPEMLNREILRTLFSDANRPILFYVGAALLLQLLAVIGELYFAMTLANTRSFLRNNALFSVLFYFGLNTVVGLLEVAAVLLIPFGMRLNGHGAEIRFEPMLSGLDFSGQAQGLVDTVTFGFGVMIVDLIVGVGLLLLTRWLLEHKVSIK